MKLFKIVILVFLTFYSLPQTAFAQSDNQQQTQTDLIVSLGRNFLKVSDSKNDGNIVEAADKIFEKQLQGRYSDDFSGYFFTISAYAYWREDRMDEAMQCAENLIRHSSDYRQAIGYKLKFYLSRDNDGADNAVHETSYQALKGFFEITIGGSATEEAAKIFIPQKYISRFLGDLKSDSEQQISDLKFKTYEMLFDLGYKPKEPFRTINYWRKEYSLGLMECGKVKQAEKMATKINSPNILRSMYVDRTYKKLWNTNSLKNTDQVMGAFNNNIERLKKLGKKHPDSLEGRQYLIKAYATIGKLDDAEKLAIQTLKDMENFGSFSDEEDYKNWIFNEIAYVYYEKGDYKRGNSYMVRAANTVEDNSKGNVSQVINYTAKLLDQGEYQKALDFQDKFMSEGGASDYGDMWIWYNQACGFYKLGQMKKSGIAMQKLAEHREDNYPAYSMSLLCTGNIDAAAQSYITRLNNPDYRSAALDAMQISKLSENEMPLDKELRTNLNKVRERPDVLTTVNKYGRIVIWPLSNTYWGDF